MPQWMGNPVYWNLVQQLMHQGWYRLGPGPALEDGRLPWGFREGHVLDVCRVQPLWIPADDELTAMRLLVSVLQDHNPRQTGRGSEMAQWHAVAP